MAPSRQKAQELLAKGRVVFDRDDGTIVKISKASTLVDDKIAARIRIEVSSGPEFVSRGGQKLFGAVQILNADRVNATERPLAIEFFGKTVFDVGISTGGFADCALQLGAKRVVGVDVGHGQLAKKMKDDPRVTLFEGVNARELGETKTEPSSSVSSPVSSPASSAGSLRERVLAANGGHKFEIIVVDVSFISLKMVLPAIASYLVESGHLLALVKPQFEVGREGLGRGGIVKNAKLYPAVETSIRDVCASLGLRVESYIESPILGSDGNREFFIHATVPQLGLF